MGIKLSSNGGLTRSQKEGLNREQQAQKLKELSKLEINRPIIKAASEAASNRKQAAKDRKADAEKKLDEQEKSSNSTKSSKKTSKK